MADDDYAPIFSPPDMDHSLGRQGTGGRKEPRPVLPPLEATPAVNPRIFELENKPKPVLAHDRGAGSPCLNCDHCPTGLDLHFWRKICRTCKCGKEDHDVHDFSEDPGKILIGRLFDRPIDTAPRNKLAYTVSQPQQHSGEAENGVKRRGAAGSGEVDGGGKLKEVEGEDDENLPTLLSPPQQNYEWIPPGTAAHLVQKYMAMLPKENRPIQGTEGAVKRRKALEYQFPLHDCDPSRMHRKLTDEESGAMTKYISVLKSEVVGQGEIHEALPHLPLLPFPPSPLDEDGHDITPALEGAPKDINQNSTKPCADCEGPLIPGDVGLFTQHSGPDVCWHPGCFKCCVCDQLLVDMLYFFKDNKYYCGRHYGNTAFPRCAGCDELIFAREYTRAEEKDWHLNHFCCYGCDVELGGMKYMVKETQPYCFNCYLHKFAHTCQRCEEKIAPDVKRITHLEVHWHATEGCFRCVECAGCLLGKKFVMKNKNVFCSSQCKLNFQEKAKSKGGTLIY